MGACCSTSAAGTEGYSAPPQQTSSGNVRLPAVGGNKVLLAVRPVWTADVAMTVTQLQRKRAEFWDTAHSYEGHREIWDALKAACESDDVKLAQAIIDSANILLPTGTLTEAYDEQGRKYNVPLYCVAEPSNLINDDGSARTSPSVAAPSSSSSASASAAASLPEAVKPSTPQDKGKEIALVLRLSTPKDLKVTMFEANIVRDVKELVHQMEKIPVDKQRIFLTGHVLDDTAALKTLKLGDHPLLQIMCMV